VLLETVKAREGDGRRGGKKRKGEKSLLGQALRPDIRQKGTYDQRGGREMVLNESIHE